MASTTTESSEYEAEAIEEIAMAYVTSKYGESFTMGMIVPAEQERARDIARRAIKRLAEKELAIVSVRIGR